MKFLTIVIPCFNEEKSLPDLIKNLESVDDRIQFFIIDNGSSDNSKNYLKKVENKLQENIKFFLKKRIQVMALVFMRAFLQHNLQLLQDGYTEICNLNLKN